MKKVKKNTIFLHVSKICCNFVRFFDGGVYCARTERNNLLTFNS